MVPDLPHTLAQWQRKGRLEPPYYYTVAPLPTTADVVLKWMPAIVVIAAIIGQAYVSNERIANLQTLLAANVQNDLTRAEVSNSLSATLVQLTEQVNGMKEDVGEAHAGLRMLYDMRVRLEEIAVKDRGRLPERSWISDQ